MLIPESGKAYRGAACWLLAMRLKIWSINFRCIANKCLNVQRRIKCVTFLPLPSCETLVSVKGNIGRKKIAENLDLVGNIVSLEEVQNKFSWLFRCKFTVISEIILKNSPSEKFFKLWFVKVNILLCILFRVSVMFSEWIKHTLKNTSVKSYCAIWLKKLQI